MVQDGLFREQSNFSFPKMLDVKQNLLYNVENNT